jgi:hypothetical protein
MKKTTENPSRRDRPGDQGLSLFSLKRKKAGMIIVTCRFDMKPIGVL